MIKLINEIKELQSKRDNLLNKYPDICTNNRRGTGVRYNMFKSNQRKLMELYVKGCELYGDDFRSKLNENN